MISNEFSFSFLSNAQDCAEGSLDDLGLHDLLFYANENAKCLREARSAFKKKYAKDTFTITGPLRDNGVNAFIGSDIRNIDVAKEFLRVFGKYVEYIGVFFYSLDESQGKEIVKQINDMCFDSTTLKTFDLVGYKGSVLDELNSVFSSVETLDFISSDSVKVRPNARKFSDIFPNAKKIRLDRTTLSDWELIGNSFPHLDDLELKLEPRLLDEIIKINVKIINFLKANSRITKLSIENSNLKFLKEVNDILPRLRNLKLNYFRENYQNYESDPIRFEQVETLTIKSMLSAGQRDHVYPDHIYFDQLQDLEMSVHPEFTDNWTKFINNQISGNLNTLELHTETLRNDQITAIVMKKPCFKEANIYCQSNISAETVIAFIKHSEYLLRLNLVVLMSQDELQLLQENVGDNWDIGFTRYTKGEVLITLTKKIKKPSSNGSSGLDIHSLQFLTISLIYVLAKFF